MAQDDDDRVPLPEQASSPRRTSAEPMPATLVRGDHRQRGEREGRHGAVRRDDRQVAEEDVADRKALIDGHEREPGVTLFANASTRMPSSSCPKPAG